MRKYAIHTSRETFFEWKNSTNLVMAGRSPTSEPNWKDLLKNWDSMQEYYLPDREIRFNAMMDVLRGTLPSEFTVLDLGCGPGSLSARVVNQFPRARVIAVDFDPVVLTIARNTMINHKGRIRWIEADLSKDDLFNALLASYGRIDAAISTTALHWLYPSQLLTLYRNLGRCIRPGGIFANGDNMPWATTSAFHRLSKRVKRIQSKSQKLDLWKKWWRGLQKDPYFHELFRIRKSRFPDIHSRAKTLSLDFHVNALRKSGFQVADVIWQDLEDRILLAIR